MPRDIGTGLYHYPEGTPGTPAQTIFSTRYNTFINDLTNTLNQALPVNMGGTGADNAKDARTNLKAEVASVQVTNYDTHAWESGSFHSISGATSEPVPGNNAAGVAIVAGSDITLQAYSNNLTFNRIKSSGVWGAWVSTQSANDARYVNVTGDTMTGDLVIAKNSPAIVLNNNSGGAGNKNIISQIDGVTHWMLTVGNYADVFGVTRCDDVGAILGSPILIDRLTGVTTFANPMVSQQGVKYGPGAGGNAIAFTWNGSTPVGGAIVKTVDGVVSAAIWDMLNSPAAGAGSGAYQKLASGQILQFGAYAGGGDVVINYPVVFPTVVQGLFATLAAGAQPASIMLAAHIDFTNTIGFRLQPRYNNAGAVGMATQPVYWFAIGY
jgi:hypothetical protein